MPPSPQKNISFSAAAAESYNRRILSLVPGYKTLQQLLSPLLSTRLPENATILLIGAGTGEDLINLAQTHPHWQFTAIDPAADMLAIAKERAVENRISHRVSFHATSLENFETSQHFDAALAILVTHFIPDTGKKKAFYQKVSQYLRPNAPFVFVDLVQTQPHTNWCSYKNWVQTIGVQKDQSKLMFERIANNFHPICEERLLQLLSNTGFSKPKGFFQALDYRGYYTRRH